MNQQPPWQPHEPLYRQQHFGRQQSGYHVPPYRPSLYNRPAQEAPRPFKRLRLTTLPPPKRQPGLWQWYKSQTKQVKLSIGCGMTLAVLLFFACIGTAVGSINLATPATQTLTIPSQQAALLDSPTATDTPTPTPTLTPTPTPKPAIAPTHAPQPTPPPPTPTPCPGVNCNPWGYNFTPGNYIYFPPAAFCSYFTCVNNFFNGRGYVVECHDGEYSKSGGSKGACFYHGGVLRPLYSH